MSENAFQGGILTASAPEYGGRLVLTGKKKHWLLVVRDSILFYILELVFSLCIAVRVKLTTHGLVTSS